MDNAKLEEFKACSCKICFTRYFINFLFYSLGIVDGYFQGNLKHLIFDMLNMIKTQKNNDIEHGLKDFDSFLNLSLEKKKFAEKYNLELFDFSNKVTDNDKAILKTWEKPLNENYLDFLKSSLSEFVNSNNHCYFGDENFVFYTDVLSAFVSELKLLGWSNQEINESLKNCITDNKIDVEAWFDFLFSTANQQQRIFTYSVETNFLFNENFSIKYDDVEFTIQSRTESESISLKAQIHVSSNSFNVAKNESYKRLETALAYLKVATMEKSVFFNIKNSYEVSCNGNITKYSSSELLIMNSLHRINESYYDFRNELNMETKNLLDKLEEIYIKALQNDDIIYKWSYLESIFNKSINKSGWQIINPMTKFLKSNSKSWFENLVYSYLNVYIETQCLIYNRDDLYRNYFIEDNENSQRLILNKEIINFDYDLILENFPFTRYLKHKLESFNLHKIEVFYIFILRYFYYQRNKIIHEGEYDHTSITAISFFTNHYINRLRWYIFDGNQEASIADKLKRFL